MDDFVVVRAHRDLLGYVDGLQRKNSESLSFYPACVFEREAEAGRLFLGLLNGEPCGYVYVGAAGGDMKCHQVCIQYDARRRLYGAALISAIEQHAEATDTLSITLRCGFDLDANEFWHSLGYECIAHRQGGIRRLRLINIWRKQLQPELFPVVALEPKNGKVDDSVWRKNKQTGIVSPFNRGRSVKDYRATVLQGLDTRVQGKFVK